MPHTVIDGLTTRYELIGGGTPLLMFSPGGFDATLNKWTTLGVYARTKMLAHLSQKYTCIVFDRRETGESGGRVEQITWAHYVEQGYGLLKHLGIDRAHVMGGCMGCSPAAAFAVAHPEATLGLVLFWPVGGPKYRITSHQRFAKHAAFVEAQGLQAVVSLAKSGTQSFGEDPRGGPWVAVLRRDADFAARYAKLDSREYLPIVRDIARTLFDRDTAPGPEPEDLMRVTNPALIVPGHDATHATSAARYFEECLPASQYWDVQVEDQTEETVPPRLLQFLDGIDAPASGR